MTQKYQMKLTLSTLHGEQIIRNMLVLLKGLLADIAAGVFTCSIDDINDVTQVLAFSGKIKLVHLVRFVLIGCEMFSPVSLCAGS